MDLSDSPMVESKRLSIFVRILILILFVRQITISIHEIFPYNQTTADSVI